MRVYSKLKIVFVIATLSLLIPVFGTAQDQYFDSSGTPIRFVELGEGEPVIMVHGFGGSLEMWRQTGVMQSLSEDFHVVAMDARGHGLSGKPHDPGQYGSQMAEDVLSLMNHLGLEKAHIVGYSMGSRLTGYLIANNSNRIISATLGASPPRRESDGNLEERAGQFIANVEESARNATSDDGQDYVALAAIPKSWGEQVVKDEQLMANQIPTFGIVGTDDPRIRGMENLAAIMPNFELVVVDGATHGSLPGRPEFISSLKQFLETQSQH